ncbi:hypothetical protein FEP63_02487 [Burkholderia multivorans]|uniref:Uncharacterized protein n=1 Tax=Burkholderia pseudomultivorans TaxID=1207504 RepID=A0A6P2J3V1_9BURK|nr:hypothetical protein [Burkholderia multivorans]VWB36902.1 hypothetical protein BPS26883_01645 [Burkholderia pseudomultivorans]MDR8783304.1 hypothetical protein [Burkholderia multivorans]MDR8883154.1 hypothetical protein [Burkholderia multivorans]MDR8886842.1 hypothetical protein [Burkholderia multivorans]MDR8896391.1 hypothetical protein [Burkholderia multivorans]
MRDYPRDHLFLACNAFDAIVAVLAGRRSNLPLYDPDRRRARATLV